MSFTTARECDCGGVRVVRESALVPRDGSDVGHRPPEWFEQRPGVSYWCEIPTFTIEVVNDGLCEDCKLFLKAIEEWYRR